MKNFKSKLKNVLLVTSTAVFTGVASAQESAVGDAVTSFSSTWATNAALVGGALIAAAFIAIGYKWVKGMIFG